MIGCVHLLAINILGRSQQTRQPIVDPRTLMIHAFSCTQERGRPVQGAAKGKGGPSSSRQRRGFDQHTSRRNRREGRWCSFHFPQSKQARSVKVLRPVWMQNGPIKEGDNEPHWRPPPLPPSTELIKGLCIGAGEHKIDPLTRVDPPNVLRGSIVFGGQPPPKTDRPSEHDPIPF